MDEPKKPIKFDLGVPRFNIGQYSKLNGQPIAPVPLKLLMSPTGDFMRAQDVETATTAFIQRTVMHMLGRFKSYLCETKGQSDEQRIEGIPKMFADAGRPDCMGSEAEGISSEGEPASKNGN